MLQRRLFNLTLNILEVGHLKRSFNYISVQPLTPPFYPAIQTLERRKNPVWTFFSVIQHLEFVSSCSTTKIQKFFHLFRGILW